jgi:hypothetical protein
VPSNYLRAHDVFLERATSAARASVVQELESFLAGVYNLGPDAWTVEDPTHYLRSAIERLKA